MSKHHKTCTWLKVATARSQTTVHFSFGRPSARLAGDASDEIGDYCDDEPMIDAPNLAYLVRRAP